MKTITAWVFVCDLLLMSGCAVRHASSPSEATVVAPLPAANTSQAEAKALRAEAAVEKLNVEAEKLEETARKLESLAEKLERQQKAEQRPVKKR
jgi:predicted ATP-grasp superfamily ATP-dependent carboligase